MERAVPLAVHVAVPVPVAVHVAVPMPVAVPVTLLSLCVKSIIMKLFIYEAKVNEASNVWRISYRLCRRFFHAPTSRRVEALICDGVI